jgi:hypothetical protein
MSYIVGGCMDSCVHIWNFQTSPEVAAAARAMAKASIAGGPRNSAPDDSTSEEGGSELVEYSCGGYSAKVTSTVFNSDRSMLATLGGTQCIVWDFTGPQGPAGSRPVIGLGHTKTVTCQVQSGGGGGITASCVVTAVENGIMLCDCFWERITRKL